MNKIEMTVSNNVPFELVNPQGTSNVLIVCDHASSALPPDYGDLGLPAEEFKRHIAYDIGAAAATRHISTVLNAPAVLACYSRLLIDLNRGHDDPTLVMKLSDGAIIPGNRHADSDEIERRKKLYYTPYHEAISSQMNVIRNRGQKPVLLSLHSFTPFWKEVSRPWHFGILWDNKDGRIAIPLLQSLESDSTPDGLPLVIGDNRPYRGELEGDCMNVHGTKTGTPHVLVEFRQDLVASEESVSIWSDILLKHLRPILEDSSIHTPL